MPSDDATHRAAAAAAAGLSVDGARVARGFGLTPEAFRALMREGRIAQLCERGVGADRGRYRVSFYLGRQRVRVVLDADGTVLQQD